MLNKQDDYLTSKLRQLKASAIGSQMTGPTTPEKSAFRESLVEPLQPPHPNQSLPYEPVITMPKIGGILTLGNPDAVPYSPKPILKKSVPVKLPPGLPIKLYGNSTLKMSLEEYEAKTESDNRRVIQEVMSGPEVRRPRSQEIIEGMRVSYAKRMAPVTDRPGEVSQTLQSADSFEVRQKATTAAFPSSNLSKSTEPLRTVHAKNPATGPLSGTDLNGSGIYSFYRNLKQSDHPSPVLGAQFGHGFPGVSQKGPQLAESTLASSGDRLGNTLPIRSVPVTTQYITNSDPTNLLESINLQKQSAAENASIQLLEQTNKRIVEQINTNNRLVEEISALRRQLDKEKQLNVTTNAQLQAELKHLKQREEEAVRQVQEGHDHLHSHSRRRIDITGHSTDLTQKYESLLYENEALRADLKRMGEISGNKILDLENGINSIARMKTLELENHAMERDKLTNNADFVVEQMRVQFNERMAECESQTEIQEKEKLRLEGEVRGIQADLAAFNQTANLKINNELSVAIRKEEERAERERQAIQNQIDQEEFAVRELQREMEEGIAKMARLEADARNRLNGRRVENLRLREELANEEAAYKRLLLLMTQERNNADRKTDEVYASKEELRDLTARINLLSSRYDEEVTGLTRDGQGRSKALQDEAQRLEVRETELLRLIELEKEKIARMMDEQQQTVAQVEATLAKALNQAAFLKQSK